MGASEPLRGKVYLSVSVPKCTPIARFLGVLSPSESTIRRKRCILLPESRLIDFQTSFGVTSDAEAARTRPERTHRFCSDLQGDPLTGSRVLCQRKSRVADIRKSMAS